jgi:transcriptional regulator with XRE-family HTH domain
MRLARLKACRERALLTQAELADACGLTQVTIARLEAGRNTPRFSTIRKLAQVLGVTPQELMGEPDQGKRAA